MFLCCVLQASKLKLTQEISTHELSELWKAGIRNLHNGLLTPESLNIAEICLIKPKMGQWIGNIAQSQPCQLKPLELESSTDFSVEKSFCERPSGILVWHVSRTKFPRKISNLKTENSIIHAQYDWTTGVPDNGNEWRKFRAVPRLYPLRSLVLYFV